MGIPPALKKYVNRTNDTPSCSAPGFRLGTARVNNNRRIVISIGEPAVWHYLWSEAASWGPRQAREQYMSRIIAVLSGAVVLLSALNADAKQERITGYVSSVDKDARKVTLDDNNTYPLKPTAEMRWIVPGVKVVLICDYDVTGLVDCGVGVAALSEDLNQDPGEPQPGGSSGFSDEIGFATPDANLPDKPVLRLRRQDK